MTDRRVNLRCDHCGNALRIERDTLIPPGTVEVVTGDCDICDYWNGGFSSEVFLDRDGKEIPPPEEDPATGEIIYPSHPKGQEERS